MGTNFYLRRVKPREVHDEYHIAKRSGGWVIHFQDSTPYRFDDNAPSYHSVDDIKRLLESGEWQLSDEYGNVFDPGDESVEKLKDLCSWVGGGRFEGKTPKRYEGVNDYKSDRPLIPSHHYRDPQGFCFDSEEFS